MKRTPPVRIKHLFKVLFWSILALLALKYFLPESSPKIAYSESERPKGIVIPSKAKNLMYDLVQCESGGIKTAINHDDGSKGSHSYGLFQWKISSFKHYNDKFKLFDVEDKEIINIIFDPYVQWVITYEVLKEKGGWRNWLNCARRQGLDRVNFTDL
jgi:hypothetical protein